MTTDAFAYNQLTADEQKALVLQGIKNFEAQHLEMALNIAANEQRPGTEGAVLRMRVTLAQIEKSITDTRAKYAALLADPKPTEPAA